MSHPDVLWGNAGTPGPPSMAKTMAQLEAVGMASNLMQLEADALYEDTAISCIYT